MVEALLMCSRPPRSAGRAPGSGRAFGLGLDRVARSTRETCPGVDPHGVLRPSPGSADLAFDEERAWPHAGRPQTLPLILARNEKLPLCSVEQEVGIAARQQARGRARPSRRRESPARLLRAATRRRVAIEPAAAIPRGRRMRQSPTGGRSLPSGRTRQPSRVRKCGGSVERARDTRRPGRSPQRRPSRRSAHARPPSGWRPCPSSRRT